MCALQPGTGFAVDVRRITAFALCLAAGTGQALADVIVTQDVVVASGTTLTLSDNHEYRGTLTVEAGARVQIDQGFQIRIGNGGSLVFEGEPGDLASFEPTGSGRWNGIVFFPGSTGDIQGARFEAFGGFAMFIDDADVIVSGSEFIDGSAPLPAGERSVILIRPFSTAQIDGCTFSVFRSVDAQPGANLGQNGRPGNDMIMVEALGAETLSVTNCFFAGIEAGRGGDGRLGTFGAVGEPGTPGILSGNGGDGGNGGPGGTGGTGGNGGLGGEALAIFLDDRSPALAATSSAVIAHNTILNINRLEGGAAGGPGVFGSPGFLGPAGTGGFGGEDGQPGEPGTLGSLGEPGIDGVRQNLQGVREQLRRINVTVSVHNNILTTGAADASFGFTSAGVAGINAASNVVSGFSSVASSLFVTGTGSVITTQPVFVDAAAGDFRPVAGSFLVDAGNNSLTPASLTTDIDGAPRFMDELSTPTTGPSGQYSVDFGAYELAGDVEPGPCPADANGDGLVSPADFNAWVIAFNTNAPECDQNGDGLCTPADFNAWVLNFNAGCD